MGQEEAVVPPPPKGERWVLGRVVRVLVLGRASASASVLASAGVGAGAGTRLVLASVLGRAGVVGLIDLV